MLKYEFAVIIGSRANAIAAIEPKELLSVFDWVINRKALRAVVISTATKNQTAIGAGFKKGDASPCPNAHAVTLSHAMSNFVSREVIRDSLRNPPSLANEFGPVGSRAAKLTYAFATVEAVEYLKLNKLYLFHNL